MINSSKPSPPIKASTQDFIEIEAVKDDILLLKDNSCSVIIAAGTTNFSLLSEEEQKGMIYSYQSLLNSLSFPVQVLILSKRVSISNYLSYLDGKIKLLDEPILQKRLTNYKEFIKNLIKKNTVLEKKFYFVIPFFPFELAIKTKVDMHFIFTRAKTALYPKKDHLMRLLKKAGLAGKVLYEQEIAELFYNLYNQHTIDRKLGSVENYSDIISTSSAGSTDAQNKFADQSLKKI